MLPIAWTIGLSLLLQVPPPETGPPVPVQLKATRTAIEEREAKALKGLAASLTGDGMARLRSRCADSYHAPGRAMVPAG